MQVIKILLLCQFLIQIHIVCIRQQLIELPFIGSVWALHLTIKSGGPRLYVDVMNTQICQMPMELRLEFMAVVCLHRMDSEREFRDDVIDKIDGFVLGILGEEF